jgi:hypothetical protein
LKRIPIVPPKGHLERPLLGGKAFGCSRPGCLAVRMRGMPWGRDCTQDDTPALGTTTTTSRGFHKGVTKEGT